MTEETNNTTESVATPENTATTPKSVQTIEAPATVVANKTNPLLLALNIVMLIGLVVLYILHFTGSGKSGNSIGGAIAKANKGNISVAFVNNDSILSNYELVKKMRADLEAKGKRLEGEVASKQQAFEKDASYFQDQVAKKTISEQSAQEIYGQLQQNQKAIYDLRDRYAAELQQSEMDMNVALIDSVMNFLKRYNDKYKFDYILGFTKGGNILFANDTLDVTGDVIKELNIAYKEKHGGK
ncbi:MAG: OmpH family outer membrane protein [Bacteroidales bacterium]